VRLLIEDGVVVISNEKSAWRLRCRGAGSRIATVAMRVYEDYRCDHPKTRVNERCALKSTIEIALRGVCNPESPRSAPYNARSLREPKSIQSIVHEIESEVPEAHLRAGLVPHMKGAIIASYFWSVQLG
jgi:hypothetical protein